MKRILLLLFAFSTLTSCVAVKEYEKINLNDPDMALSDLQVKRFELNAQAYR